MRNRKEERGKVRSRDGYLKKGVRSWNPLTNYVIHALNILLECIERNTSLKIGEQFKDLMIDWSCVKIVKHLCKILFSEGWTLWAKLDTSQKKICMFVITRPSLLNNTNPNLSFVIICTQLWKTLQIAKNLFKKCLSQLFKKLIATCIINLSVVFFLKFYWLTLIPNWRNSSKQCCHSKSLITQRPYGHQQRRQALFLCIDLRNVYICENYISESLMFL